MSDEMRILFTGVGRRVELLRAFREASFSTDIPLRIYGADMDSTAPALLWCDEVRMVCPIRDQAYIPQLLEICETDSIDLLIPTIDTDLLLLAQNRERFEALGTKVFIADADKVALCRDKRLTGTFFESCGLLAPEACDDWRLYDGPYPCFIKPKDGSSSINTFKVPTANQLRDYAEKVEDYIVQPFVAGREYTIDAFCDYEGNPVSIVPRERLAVRAGEVLKTRIDLDDRMIYEASSILRSFRPRGPITIQLIRDKSTGEDWFIEINPRYGGGAPLSMRAGARTAEWALSWIGNEEGNISSDVVQDGVVFSRFDDSVTTMRCGGKLKIRGIIFDLDDTLYLERDYVRSGFRSIAKHLGDIVAAEELWGYFLEGLPAIDKYVEVHCCAQRKNELLDIYRNHRPDLMLATEVQDTLEKLRARGFKIGIITDGRPEGQRAKLDALGLWDLVDDVVITDELGGPQFRKPCDIAFRVMQRRWGIPFEEMAYVGDNLLKDFQAPQQLGMRPVFLQNLTGLYAVDQKPSSGIVVIPNVQGIMDLASI